MVIGAVIIIFIFSLLCWSRLDSWAKLTNKPVIQGKFVRFLFVHCGSYNENEIIVNGGRVSIPSKQNLYSISKFVMTGQIISFIYFAIVIALDAICLVTENNILYWFSIPLACIYLLFAIILFIIGGKKQTEIIEQQCAEKFIALSTQGFKNTITIKDAINFVKQGRRLSFNLYGISFEFSIYKKDDKKGDLLQLVDLSHMKILLVNRDFATLTTDVQINLKSLSSLWPYLAVEVK